MYFLVQWFSNCDTCATSGSWSASWCHTRWIWKFRQRIKTIEINANSVIVTNIHKYSQILCFSFGLLIHFYSYVHDMGVSLSRYTAYYKPLFMHALCFFVISRWWLVGEVVIRCFGRLRDGYAWHFLHRTDMYKKWMDSWMDAWHLNHFAIKRNITTFLKWSFKKKDEIWKY